MMAKGLRHFKLNGDPKNPHIATYVPGKKSEASFIRIHKISEKGDCGVVVNKSFFAADYVNFQWNDRGTDLLALATKSESDKSYYGEQMLYLLSITKGGSAMQVPMPREGSIYDVKWKPNYVTTEDVAKKSSATPQLFVACHGVVPATVTIFDCEGDVKGTFGRGPWNSISFNTHGNLIMLNGTGNIPGNVSVYEFKKKQKLSSIKFEDATSFDWTEDGHHFIASTTTPKLRVNNGFTLFRHSGELIVRWDVERRAQPKAATEDLPAQHFHELYHVLSLPLPREAIPSAPNPENGKVDPEVNSLAGKANAEIKANRYVPPSLRAQGAGAGNVMIRKTGPVGLGNEAQAQKTPTAEQNKRISTLKKKLTQIQKLKDDKAAGKKLDAAQNEKLKSEKKLANELAQLTVNKK